MDGSASATDFVKSEFAQGCDVGRREGGETSHTLRVGNYWTLLIVFVAKIPVAPGTVVVSSGFQIRR